MSACSDNLLRVVHKLAASGVAPDSTGLSLLRQILSLESWDRARAAYYADAQSLKVFDWVQQYRAAMSLYAEKVPVVLDHAPFTEEAWAKLEQRAAALQDGVAEGDYLLDRLDVWILESYSLPGECEAQAGDVVLDCGAYTGNTSLYFSRKVGEAGHVYGFEAAPATFEKYRRNMSGKANVTPVQAAVCDLVGQVRFAGEAANAAIREDGAAVAALSLDDFCARRGVARVDFIKMDIEGAEARALEGARGIIRRHAPKMAVSAYHQEDDILRLPCLILDINPAYRFKLRHFSPVECETVLFCIPDAEGAGGRSSPCPKRLGRALPVADGGDEPGISAGDCKRLVRLLMPLLLAGMERYESSLAARFAAVEGMLGTLPRFDEENRRLLQENQALRRAVDKLLAERQADQR
ncbi:MAG: FkbM family methyltransferase [Deltaproteobacteria bacterium]|jgi:FkbM family methyltransferase|nr:FkbM family methyltransferase [Deltaproteobacteria bacterium]